MINGFEEQTHDLTEHEITVIVPVLVKTLGHKVGRANSVTNGDMVHGLKANRGIITSEPRIRKMIYYIRDKDLVPGVLIASANGYWVSFDPDEIKTHIESLKQREDAIARSRRAEERGLQNLLNSQ